MILSPASLVGLQRAQTETDQCSRRYGGTVDSGGEVCTAAAAVAPEGSASSATPAQLLDVVESPQKATQAPPRSRAAAPAGAAATEVIAPAAARTSGGATIIKDAPDSPAPTSEEQLVKHLQSAFQRLDKKGSGTAPTDALLRSLRTMLASQTASLRASRGWASGIRQICSNLEANIEEARDGGVLEGLSSNWEDLLELAERVQAQALSDHPLGLGVSPSRYPAAGA